MVAVSKRASESPPLSSLDAGALDPATRDQSIEAAMQQTARQAQRAARADSVLPKKYADQRTSDQVRDVVAGENVIDLELVGD